jgi:hypothetical protein
MLTRALALAAPRSSYALTLSACVRDGAFWQQYEYGKMVSSPGFVAPSLRTAAAASQPHPLEVRGEVPLERLEVDGRGARRQKLVGQIAHPHNG